MKITFEANLAKTQDTLHKAATLLRLKPTSHPANDDVAEVPGPRPAQPGQARIEVAADSVRTLQLVLTQASNELLHEARRQTGRGAGDTADYLADLACELRKISVTAKLIGVVPVTDHPPRTYE